MIELRYNFLQWFKRHHFLHVFGFLFFFRPAHPFIYELLTTNKNVKESQYIKSIEDIGAYSKLGSAIILFFLVSFCSYHFIFFFICVFSLTTSVLNWKGHTFFELQLAEGLGGCVSATEIFYYASIYVFDKNLKNYSRATAHVRAVPLLSQTVAGILSQILISGGMLNYEQLAFFNIPALAHAILILTHFPFLTEHGKSTLPEKLRWFKTKFKETLLTPHFCKWCLWAALTLCARTRFITLMQPFWDAALTRKDETLNNGALEGISSFLALLSVLLSGMFPAKGKHENKFFLAISVLHGGLLFGLAGIEHVWDSTIIYLVLEIVYHFAFAKVSATIAESVSKRGSFGIAFGLVGIVSSIFNVIYANLVGHFGFSFQEQFVLYGIHHTVIAVFIIMCSVLKL